MKPVTWSVPHRGPISKKLSLSAISRIARRTSNVAVRLRGTRVSSSSSRRSALSVVACTGAAS